MPVNSQDSLKELMSMSESKSNGFLLAQLFLEVGYVATVAKENAMSLIQSVYNGKKMIEMDVAIAMASMANTHTGLVAHQGKDIGLIKVHKEATSWNIQIFIETILELFPNISWDDVLSGFDYSGFEIIDAKSFEMIIKGFSLAIKDALKFPIHLLWTKWTNKKGQLSFLKFIAGASTELFPLMSLPVKKVVTEQQTNSQSSSTRSLSTSYLSVPWNCQNLIDTLLIIAEDDALLPVVKQVMELPARLYPEFLILGLAQSNLEWTKFHRELVSSLIQIFLASHSNPSFVVSKLWSIDSKLVTDAMVHIYSQDNTKLSRLLDIAHELKALNVFLELCTYPFVIDFASLASRREYLNLEKWLIDRIQRHGSEFIQACIEFLYDRMIVSPSNESQLSHSHKTLGLAPEVFTILIKQISAFSGSLNNDSKKRLHEILEVTPKTNAFPEDVEKEANSYFERLFNEAMQVSEVIESLQTFKNSSNKRDRQVWECVVYSLFEEHRYFLRYPERELNITGNLFGALLARNMFEGPQRTTALRMLVESIGKSVNQKLFRCFAVQTVLQLKPKLSIYPEICEIILQSDAIREHMPDLIALAESSLYLSSDHRNGSVDSEKIRSSPNSSDVSSFISARDYSQCPADGVFFCLRDVTFRGDEEDSIQNPDPETEEKILFLFNNLNSTNLGIKAKELKELIGETHLNWFAYYLVKKRAYVESNLQKMYAQIVDIIDSPHLNIKILIHTYACCKTFLNSPTLVLTSSANERGWLKNLGSWLGLLTLGHNKPILHKYMPLKEVLIEAYDRNRSLLIIPFVCKILEQSNGSKIFRPANAWVTAILRTLLELYILATRQTKGLAIIFEIESLWNKLNLTYKDERLHYVVGNESKLMEPSTILREKPQDSRTLSASGPPSQTFIADGRVAGSLTTPVIAQSYPDRTLPIKEVSSSSYSTVLGTSALSNIINQQPILRRLIQLVVEQTVREIGAVIRDKATIITRFVTQTLIIKDFAVESNEEEMRKAAHHLARFLAENLAIVNCRESLRPLFISNLRFYVDQYQVTGLTDDMLQIIMLECFESTSAIIENETVSASLTDIDRQLSEAYMLRKRHRERTGQPYYDVSNFALAPDLAESLSPKPGGLMVKHYNLYREFSEILKIRHMNRTAPSVGEPSLQTSSSAPQRSASSIINVTDHLIRESLSGMLPAQLLQQSWELISRVLSEVDKMAYTQDGTFSSMQSNVEFVALVRQLTALLTSIATRDDTVRTLGIRIVQNMYVTSSNIGREMRAFCLEKMCEGSKRFHEELVSYVMGSNDESRFNVEVMLLLTRARILALPELDHYFSRLLEMGRPTFICFVVHAMIVFLFSEGRMSNQVDFQRTYELLNRLHSSGRLPKSAIMFLEEIQTTNRQVSYRDLVQTVIAERCYFLCEEWQKICFYPPHDKSYVQFVAQIKSQGFFRNETITDFYRDFLSASLETYLRARSSGSVTNYHSIDCYVKLAVLIPRILTENTIEGNLSILSRMMNAIHAVFVSAYERLRVQFPQKAFHRLLIGLIVELSKPEPLMDEAYLHFLLVMSQTLETIAPSAYPVFAFSWLDIVSHRLYLPKLLDCKNPKAWWSVQFLLIAALRFAAIIARGTELREGFRAFYRGVTRVLIVLLHDYPGFLSEYYPSLCEPLPPHFVQLRNIILCAAPKNIRLPSPFASRIKIDSFPEFIMHPVISSLFTNHLMVGEFKQELDDFLKFCKNPTFLETLPGRLAAFSDATGNKTSRYNTAMLNALILYAGIRALNQIQGQDTVESATSSAHVALLEICNRLLNSWDSEGRYLLIHAITTHLRYPNANTRYFTSLILILFRHSNDTIREQITRVLLERVHVMRPHPWGLYVALIELLRNPEYSFWEYKFTSASPEIHLILKAILQNYRANVDPETRTVIS